MLWAYGGEWTGDLLQGVLHTIILVLPLKS